MNACPRSFRDQRGVKHTSRDRLSPDRVSYMPTTQRTILSTVVHRPAGACHRPRLRRHRAQQRARYFTHPPLFSVFLSADDMYYRVPIQIYCLNHI